MHSQPSGPAGAAGQAAGQLGMQQPGGAGAGGVNSGAEAGRSKRQRKPTAAALENQMRREASMGSEPNFSALQPQPSAEPPTARARACREARAPTAAWGELAARGTRASAGGLGKAGAGKVAAAGKGGQQQKRGRDDASGQPPAEQPPGANFQVLYRLAMHTHLELQSQLQMLNKVGFPTAPPFATRHARAHDLQPYGNTRPTPLRSPRPPPLPSTPPPLPSARLAGSGRVQQDRRTQLEGPQDAA